MTKTRATHTYSARLIWDGNLGEGTSSYAGYGREYRVLVADKPVLAGTADAAFRGRPDLHNPEDMFLAAIAGCHMLSYLALAALQGVTVVSYEDEATATMTTRPDGGGAFDEVTLNPRVMIAAGSDEALALELHDAAHERCFIANSCSVPIHHRPTIEVEAAAAGA